MERRERQTYLQSTKTRGDEKEQLIRDLRGADIFAGLSTYELEQIAKVCSQRTYQNGELCAVQGETIDELRIVTGGKVAVEVRLEVAPFTQTLTVTTLTPGNVFAYCSVVTPYVLIASGRCIGQTQIVSIKAPDLQRIFKERPSIEIIVMRNIATVMCSKLRDSMTQLGRLVTEMIKQGQ